MNNRTSLHRKATLVLAPAFALLSACGGDPPSSSTPEGSFSPTTEASQAARPADYGLDTQAALIGDEISPSNPDQSSVVPQQDLSAAASNAETRLLATTLTAPAVRDPFKQPFATNSIWNMPIGSGAVFMPARISGNPGNNIWAKMPGIDDEHIVFKPTSPLTRIDQSLAAWTGRDRCAATGRQLLRVPMPRNYIVPNSTSNSSSAFLMPDKRTIVQAQPVARCTAGGPATALVNFAPVDLYGPGITGAHGGSGLSAVGGTIRVGELRPGSTGPRHVLKLAVYAREVLYRCTSRSTCFRWPAVTSDSYAVGNYGISNPNSNPALKMGSLLAIPPATNLTGLGLETAPAKQLAWTLQNYGAYIVDDTYAPGFFLNAEVGPDGSVPAQFKADYGFEMMQKVQGNTAWMRDVQRLAKALHVVTNNGPASIGGGGTPRQRLAPPI